MMETETVVEATKRPRGRPAGQPLGTPNVQSPVFEGFITFEQLAADSGRSIRTVRRWAEEGMPHVKRGNLCLVPIEAARAWFLGADETVAKPPRKRSRNGTRKSGR